MLNGEVCLVDIPSAWTTLCRPFNLSLSTDTLGHKARPCVSFIHRVVAALRPRDPPSAQTAELVCALRNLIEDINHLDNRCPAPERITTGFLAVLAPVRQAHASGTAASILVGSQLPYSWPRTVASISLMTLSTQCHRDSGGHFPPEGGCISTEGRVPLTFYR
jgi:hypothetical protein